MMYKLSIKCKVTPHKIKEHAPTYLEKSYIFFDKDVMYYSLPVYSPKSHSSFISCPPTQSILLRNGSHPTHSKSSCDMNSNTLLFKRAIVDGV